MGGLPLAVIAGRAAPATVNVRVADQKLARAAGVAGVVLAVSPVDSAATGATVKLRLDYAGFANAFGSNFGARLRLVRLPGCALTTPDVPSCQQQEDLGSVNAAGSVTAEVGLSADTAGGAGGRVPGRAARVATQPVVLALSGTPSSGGGTFSATSLTPAYSWSAGSQGGEFSFNYPLRVPASVGGPAPKLSLSYNSGMVDAQTLAENGQTSWVGEGWDLQTGYIERAYRPCIQEGGSTADPCWFSSYNATMVFNGSAVRLIRDDATGVWHTSSDSALRVEALTDPTRGNGDNDGEYWRVTTQDGTQYYFGANLRYAGDPARTNSTQVQPVYGDDPGEPCYNPTFAAAWCEQAYRWNLDYVVDPRGNTMTMFYAKSSGYVGLNNNTNVQPYDFDAKLDHIDYGTRAGSEGAGNAPMQAWFTRTGRCINTCQTNTSDYPDSPWDLYCPSSVSCPNLVQPVYWTQFKLSNVYTRVWDAGLGAYRKVDQWDLTHTYPATGDNISPAGDDTAPNLWLQTVTHTGYAADGTTTLAEPAVTFGGTGLFNRVDWGNDIGVSPYNHFRLTSIVNGMGGQTLVSYSTPQCDRSFQPNVEANPYRCFPEFFKPTLAPAGWGWFHKYVVTSVTDKDLTGGSPDEVTSYAYSTAGSSDPSLWHHDFAETIQLAFRSWLLWHGYSTVTITHGASGPQSVTRNQYFRGMDNDGMATTPNDGMVWGSRRVGVTTPVTLAGAAAIAGTGGGCLNLVGGGTADGTRLELRDCTGAAGQVFQMGQDFTMRNPGSGKCIAVNGTGNGSIVDLRPCDASGGQIWMRSPDGSLQNPQSGRCLEVNGATVGNGGVVDLWDCPAGAVHDIWLPRSDGTLYQPQERRCLDISGAVYADGTAIQNWGCLPNQPNQQWLLQSNKTLVNPTSGKCLTLTAAGTGNGTTVELQPCTAAASQLWTPQADGSLKNPGSGRCLDATATPYSGTRPVLWDCNSGTAPSRTQRWVDYLVDAEGTEGFLRETTQLDGTTAVTVNTFVPTATRTALRSAPVTGGQDLAATMVTGTNSYDRTWLSTSSTWRWMQTQTSYDGYGLPTDVRNVADTAVTSDDTCTHIDYARNTSGGAYLVNLPSQQITTDCAAAPSGSNYLTGSQTYYDGSTTLGAAPTKGLPTLTKDLASVSGTTLTWAQSARSGYDANGRVTSSYDALDHLTSSAYTPASGGPVTLVTTTNPLLWTSSVAVEPGKGSVTTVTDPNNKHNRAQYDPLGRLTKAWLHDRPTTSTPDQQFTYTLSASGPNSIQEQVLGPAGTQISSFQLYDGRTRLRQSQTPAPVANGGRMVTDNAYDNRGLSAKTSAFWNNTGAPSATLVTFADSAVPTQHRFTYDTLQRVTADAFYSLGTQQFQTGYLYQGDRSAELAPPGGTTTQTFFDARGNTTSQRQYQSTSLTGTFQTTTYTYDRLNRIKTAKDPSNNSWSHTYDLRGRLTSQVSPDTGTTSHTYDNADEELSATAGGVKLVYAYDALGRRTETRLTSSTGPVQATWTYDSLAKGQATSSTSFVGSTGYTTAITGYDSAYRATGMTVTIPAAEGALGGTWTSSNTYNVDGSPASLTYPAAGGMAAETVNYTYDAVGFQLTAGGPTGTYVSGATFQPWGDLYQQVLGTGSKRVRVTTDEYADTHRMKTVGVGTENQTTPGTYDEQLTQLYHWNPAGDLTSVDSQHAGSTTDSQCYTYDWLRQLTAAWTTTPGAGGCAATPSTTTVGGPSPYWTTWTYDLKTGNRTGQTQHGLGGAADTTAAYTYPAAGATRPHGLSSVAVTGPAGSTSNTYTYDTAGRTSNATINALSTDYTWTSEGRLGTATVHAVGGDQNVSYVYDTAGDVLIRRTPTGNTLYLGGTEVTTNSAGTLTGATRTYMCNGVVVATRTLSGVSWLASDHEGTAQLSVNATTLATTVRRQDPFGNSRGTPPAWPNQQGFVGGTNEPTGLVRLGVRMYDPTTGRFLSADRILNVGDPQAMNGYSYAENDPSSQSDPSGLAGIDPANHGSGTAHDTAVEMREAVLRVMYPNAIIDSAIPSSLHGPDLVCWGCAPGEVWVWEFKSENQSMDPAEMVQHKLQAKADPRTRRGMKVVDGPTFFSIGGPTRQWSVNPAQPNQLVTVYDYAPGWQLYGTDEYRPQAQAKRDEREDEAAGVFAEAPPTPVYVSAQIDGPTSDIGTAASRWPGLRTAHIGRCHRGQLLR